MAEIQSTLDDRKARKPVEIFVLIGLKEPSKFDSQLQLGFKDVAKIFESLP